MTKRKALASLPDRAGSFAQAKYDEIQLVEVTTSRPVNLQLELELALAYMRGYTDAVKSETVNS